MSIQAIKTCDVFGCQWESHVYPLTYQDPQGEIRMARLCPDHYANARSRGPAKDNDWVQQRMNQLFGERHCHLDWDDIKDNVAALNLMYRSRTYTATPKEATQIKEAKDKMRALVASVTTQQVEGMAPRGQLGLFGKAGNGKTSFQAVFAREMIKAGLTVTKWEGHDLTSKIRSLYSARPSEMRRSIRETIEAMVAHDVVILDDMTEGCFASDMRDRIFEIVDSVYSRCKIVSMSSNYTFKQLADWNMLGEATMDRLLETPSAIIHFDIESLRRASYARDHSPTT